MAGILDPVTAIGGADLRQFPAAVEARQAAELAGHGGSDAGHRRLPLVETGHRLVLTGEKPTARAGWDIGSEDFHQGGVKPAHRALVALAGGLMAEAELGGGLCLAVAFDRHPDHQQGIDADQPVQLIAQGCLLHRLLASGLVRGHSIGLDVAGKERMLCFFAMRPDHVAFDIAQHRGRDPGGRVPAGEIEATVIDQLRAVFRQPEIVAGTWRAARTQNGDITEADAREALIRLDPLWDELFPAEQARIVGLLVERVDIGTTGLNVRLRMDGLAGLTREMATDVGKAA